MEQEIDARREAIFCGGLTSGISSLLDNRDEKPYKNIILCGKTKAFLEEEVTMLSSRAHFQ